MKVLTYLCLIAIALNFALGKRIKNTRKFPFFVGGPPMTVHHHIPVNPVYVHQPPIGAVHAFHHAVGPVGHVVHQRTIYPSPPQPITVVHRQFPVLGQCEVDLTLYQNHIIRDYEMSTNCEQKRGKRFDFVAQAMCEDVCRTIRDRGCDLSNCVRKLEIGTNRDIGCCVYRNGPQ
jgi:hypothetical protein